MNIALWIFQSLLAFAFCAAGGTKLAKDRAALLLDKRMAWASEEAPAVPILLALLSAGVAVGRFVLG